MDVLSASMTTNCRTWGCKGTGIAEGEKCPTCGWERPKSDAVDYDIPPMMEPYPTQLQLPWIGQMKPSSGRHIRQL